MTIHSRAVVAPAPSQSSASAEMANQLAQLKTDRQNLAAEREDARRLQVKLELVAQHGLQNTRENDAFLDNYFPGPSLTVKNVYDGFKANRIGGVLLNGQPFAKLENENAANIPQADQNRRNFDTVCRACTAQGIDVAGSDSNYKIVQDYVQDSGGNFSIQWLASRMGNIAGLHPNNPETSSGIDAEARQKLWAEVDDSLQFRDNRGQFHHRNDLESQQIK